MTEYFQAIDIPDYSLRNESLVRGAVEKCRHRLRGWGVKDIQEHWEMIDEDGCPRFPSSPIPDSYEGPVRWHGWGSVSD